MSNALSLYCRISDAAFDRTFAHLADRSLLPERPSPMRAIAGYQQAGDLTAARSKAAQALVDAGHPVDTATHSKAA